ncbi:TPA: bifunctional methylenetetrahydrofolate dehydrogenase/methenyltetrahydrofolate cyclohydrolase [candidate division CPR2 bacterium]|uniref:Bifunctional protein FolD n=1 Tax=candidate division CPR2 bacterium GW2011_GWC1_41_48 TaxID=1618344 RepID=A0A0G0WA24_UNCC2|nr:MAG: Bifunctional protein FolD [candidate division CPR2 bacterium GW2011_GWC2_39_35]KKR27928.1 MAG: Bifunctional protein FolD [candidate division CPR2 bacterium GW2011_GWD2_39_7]KKS08902.1 MAG: Bifunctional protein FolD [candidate division CPR2 bacterium GW2011_GWC1_41_48]OGB72045.1 MAG: bifunctional methylenetetrahydrofolate dehydrogenase/methenyltetrahydrofolate cyclohydrolase [candidate division CPR2 bacterium GWD2_39_7]HBG81719.1 bifunctional methylenetetrahydrofolate dehydrogenase/methe
MILDGQKVAQVIYEKLKKELKWLASKPKLAVILVGENPASESYVKIKEETAKAIGIDFELFKFASDIDETEVISRIELLNNDTEVSGVLVQLPLPAHFDETRVLQSISPKKDVDGLNALNLGKMLMGLEALYPATALAVLEILDFYEIPIEGRHAVVIGKSNLVGKPVADMLLNRSATVTVCHERTEDLQFFCKRADILVSAVGKANLIGADMIKDGSVIIDVGVNKVGNKLVGDVDFKEGRKRASAITPVPGGVGPVTVVMLMKNVFQAYKEA